MNRHSKQSDLKSSILACVRVAMVATVFLGPIAGLAVANAEENARPLTGAGFVLYVSLMRG